MKLQKIVYLLLLVLLITVQGGLAQSAATPQVSGKVVNGLRLLKITPGQENRFVVYRGDYIQPELTGSDSFSIQFSALQVDKTFPVKAGERAYIKMKQPGRYRFTVGAASGSILVIEYAAASYRELSAAEAEKILQNTNPLILDVRTQGEFQRGYIQGAKLLPVQVLQQNIENLQQYKNQDILLYCASGNRSTVASRLLIESGFMKIYNLRYGINDWAQRGHPVAR